jgi:hypothetical protein
VSSDQGDLPLEGIDDASSADRDERLPRRVPVDRPPAPPAVPSTAEKRQMRLARRTLARQPPPTELRVGHDKWASPIVGLPHTDEEGWWAQARMAFGTVSSPFVEAEIERLLTALRSCRTTLPLETAVNAALAVIAGQKPQNEAEAMLAIQMALMHVMAMEMLGRVGRLDAFAHPELTAVAGTTATKLVRAFAGHVETLHKIRRPPVQTVRVERVNVEAGGQAMVGAITGPGALTRKSD